jgi:two-component system, chemotaxis family, chemotaxis protein CheY
MNYQKILIVDDSSTSRMIIKRCFEIAGCTEADYFEAEDGMEAMTLLHDTPIDLILTDLKMPKMDGRTLIQKLKITEHTGRIPVVVISSIGEEDAVEQLKSMGVRGVIRKPISPEKALRVLEV